MTQKKDGLKAIFIIVIIIILLLISVYVTDSYFIKILPQSIDSTYILFITIAVTLLALSHAVTVLNKKGSASTKPINYLRDSGKELKELADKSESIINAIGDGVILIDPSNVIKILNPAAAQMLGWEQEDTIGLNYKSVLKLTDNEEGAQTTSNDIIYQAISTNTEMRSPSVTLKTHSNNQILASLVVSPIGDVGAGMIVVFRDVTKEKQEEKEQAEFISTASHEMRTPVASIEGYLGLALNPETSTIDERAKDYITKAQESVHHLGRLFQDLLDISKADDNRLTSNPKVIDVIEFTENVIDGLKTQASEKGLELKFKSTGKMLTDIAKIQPVYYANVDNDHLRELITNLTENALKYTLQGGVTLDVNGDNDHIVISIQDTGIGIPGENLPHLFQKFYRVNNKETSDIGGTGLGLYLARKLAESMNGRVWAESQYGKGSTFFIEIPRITSQAASQLQSTQTNQETLNNTSKPKPEGNPNIAPPQIESQTNIPAQPELPEPIVSPMSNYSVPRGDVLTPEQKAAYSAKLSQQAAANNTTQIN